MVMFDSRGGYAIGTRDSSTPIERFTSWAKGGEVRWATPISGLTAGYSVLGGGGHGDARLTALFGQPIPGGGLPCRFENRTTLSHQFYGDYQRGAFRTFAEYRLSDGSTALLGLPMPTFVTSSSAWYVAGTYRVHPKVELGSYYNSSVYQRNLGFSPSNGIRGPIEQVTHTDAAHAQETAAAAVSVNEQVRATQDQIDWLEVVVGH